MKGNFPVLWTAASLICAQVSQCLPPTVIIDSGILVGTTTSVASATATVNKFLGIPFAVSPPERFSPPVPAPKSLRVLDVTAWKPACTQQFVFPLASAEFAMAVFDSSDPPESEDCLYLNVYAPSTSPPPGGFTVMFWIYGGSLQFGDAGQPGYDGASFAAFQNVILVSTNYRTNVFGFPNIPEFPITEQNLGFLDQRLALQWVQSNIKSFGGNPDKVTIFGQSAGATSVDALVTSFVEDPPFRAAILQSGQADLLGDEPVVPNPGPWAKLIDALNCSSTQTDLECARAAPATTIKTIISKGSIVFPPVNDNVTLVAHPETARRDGNIANVPILTGTTSQEGRAFTFGDTNLTSFIDGEFSGSTALQAEIAAAYPVDTPELPTAFDAIAQIFTEFIFQCPAAIVTNDSITGGFPTWRYYYNATFPDIQPFPGLGVYHSSEIPVVFGTFTLANPAVAPTAQEIALSKTVQTLWATFAKDPLKGPGWAEGPDVLANIGSDGSTGFDVIEASLIDERCPIFAPVYAELGRLA